MHLEPEDVQIEILKELRRMNSLLIRIANNTSRDGSFIAEAISTDDPISPS